MSDIDWSKAPTDATHYAPPIGVFIGLWAKQIDGVWHYHRNDSEGWYYGAQPMSNENYIARPAPQWSGEGLPPVGTVCEVDGEKVFVVAHHMNGINAIYAEAADSGLLYYGEPNEFRPIRTPEQIAAEEREKAYKGMVDDLAAVIGISNIDARECDVLHALADAGYRKTEAP